mgnify:CR=1 FL=1
MRTHLVTARSPLPMEAPWLMGSGNGPLRSWKVLHQMPQHQTAGMSEVSYAHCSSGMAAAGLRPFFRTSQTAARFPWLPAQADKPSPNQHPCFL